MTQRLYPDYMRIILVVFISLVFFSHDSSFADSKTSRMDAIPGEGDYRVLLFRKQQLLKEYLAKVIRSNPGFSLTSEVQPQMKFNHKGNSNFQTRFKYNEDNKGLTLEGRFKNSGSHYDFRTRDIFSFKFFKLEEKKTAEPISTTHWQSPVAHLNKKNFIKNIISQFGDERKKGHRHAGIDIKGNFSARVRPLVEGQVVYISHLITQKSITLKHQLKNQTFYTSYAHLRDIKVEAGQKVTLNEILGRLLSKEELQKASHRTNHLHLEIRKTFLDYGFASISIQNLPKLKELFYDPVLFLSDGNISP